MIYNSAQEIYREIEHGKDLYFEDSEVYVFIYAERGSIAYYYLPKEELMKYAQEAGPGNYIGGVLGPGGFIIDPDIILPNGEVIEYGAPEYAEYEDGKAGDDWSYEMSPIYDFLAKFIGEECIYAMPSDLVDFEEE